ncbi:MAG: hypothetical protein N0A24_01465, partial [Armatimonadetes bacterium]|nr:hypothetical protein [Armatimonadota bacterium]MDW8152885.1 hypothetical protein [Armatimonadota bacterium]
GLTPSLLAGVTASGAVLGGTLATPPVRHLLGLARLSGIGAGLVVASMVATVLASRLTARFVQEVPATNAGNHPAP